MGRKTCGLLAAFMLAALSACGPAPEASPTATPVPQDTPTPVVTASPVTRRGGWLDEIHLSLVDRDAAAQAVASGALHVYTDAVYPWQAGFDAAAPLNWPAYLAVTFNPVDGSDWSDPALNPFADPAVRRAVSRAVDRAVINAQWLAGVGMEKYTPLSGVRADRELCQDACDEAASRLAYDLQGAQSAVTSAMEGRGAQRTNGVWTAQGKPVAVRCLIQNDEAGLAAVGDYVAGQLEALGFAVERIYGTAAELAPRWLTADPSAGGWNVHVGLWEALPLDTGEGAAFLAQSRKGPLAAYPLWQRFAADDAAEEAFLALAGARWSDEGRHGQLLSQAVAAAAQASYVVYLADVPAMTPAAGDVSLARDVVAGAGGSSAALTLGFTGREGGVMNWGAAALLDGPLGPLTPAFGGDARLADLVSGGPLACDPDTGEPIPLQMESVEFTGPGLSASWSAGTGAWQTGGGGSVTVPDDALAQWDAAAQRWLTAGEAGGRTAATKTTVVYRADLSAMTWHDGSPLTAADFMMGMILLFDPADPASACYDGAWAALTAPWRGDFVAFSIVSADPLTVTYYGSGGNDLYAAVERASLWPRWGGVEAAWSVLALGLQAQADGVLTFSPATAAMGARTTLIDLVEPDCAALLAQYARQARQNAYVPYEPTMGQYVSAEQAAARYGALLGFYEQYGHLWVGTGPYILTGTDRQTPTADLAVNTAYIDLADRWSRLAGQ